MTLRLPVVTTLTDRVSPGLRNMQAQAERTRSAFEGVGSALAGVAVGAFITRAVQAQTALKNMADATGISVRAVDGWSQAMNQAGGTTVRALDAMADFTKNIGSAAGGSRELQAALAQVGVSTQDLGMLTMEQLLGRVTVGLSRITDQATRYAVAAKLMGEGTKGVDFVAVAQNQDRLTRSSRANAEALAAQQKAQANLAEATNRLQTAVVNALQPFAEAIAKIPEEKLDGIVDAVIKIGAAAGALVVLGPILNGLRSSFLALAGVIGVVATGFAAWKVSAAAGLSTAAITAGSVITQMTGAARAIGSAVGPTAKFLQVLTTLEILMQKRLAYAIQSLAALIGVRLNIALARMIGFVGVAVGSLWALNSAVEALTGTNIVGWITRVSDHFGVNFRVAIDDANSRLAVFLKLLEKSGLVRLQIPELPRQPGGTGADAQRAMRAADAAADARAAEEAAAIRTVKLEEEKKLKQDAARQAAEAAAREAQRVAEAIRDQARALQDTVRAYQVTGAEQRRQAEQAVELIGLTAEQRAQREAQSAVENRYLTQVTDLQHQYADAVRSGRAEDLATLPRIAEAIAAVTAGYESQLAAVTELTGTQQRLEGSLRRNLEVETQLKNLREFSDQARLNAERQIQELQRNTATIGMSQIQRKYLEIQWAAEDAAAAAIRAENARRAALDRPEMSAEEQADYYRQARVGLDQVSEAARVNHEAGRTWSAGWQEAFNIYIDNATNAAQSARNVFESVTGRMGEALDRFVETGKLRFGDLARSIISDILKIQLRAQAAKFFEILFGTGAGAPQAGSTPGIASALFGGFFAAGGRPPLGRVSVVGERGPELFVPDSAGTIVPNSALAGLGGGGGNTYITNNITALDARSVAQLFAENRRTLFGAVETARRELPGRTRG